MEDQKPQQQEQATPENNPASARAEIPIVGRFDRYRSSYWAGMVAALGMRYIPRPFWRQHFDQKSTPESHFDKHKYSAFAGAMMTGVAGYYAMRTWADIRTVFAQTVAWEAGKDVGDVTFTDFWNSKNSVVQQTINNYIKFNVKRFAVNSVFFAPFFAKKTFQKLNLHGESGVDFGVAANAAYLFSDVMTRQVTPFEEMQSLIDGKINHADHFADKFVATDILDIYERHAAGNKSKSFMPLRGTEKWNDALALFDRMAELMNQKYGNEVAHEHARFGFSKFIHLLGTGKLDPAHIDNARAFVEIANHYGVKEVDKAAGELAKGTELASLMERYPLAAEPLKNGPESEGGKPASYAKKHEQKQQAGGYAARERDHKSSTQTLAI